jgi:NAD(P)-dependent dehydrogenase (short-subunit alcohol dehydrogenase family)
MSRIRLITGSASAVGRNIAEAVLASGDRLVALAHDLRHPEDLAELYGVQIRVAPLTSQTLSAFRTRGIGLCRPEQNWRSCPAKAWQRCSCADI